MHKLTKITIISLLLVGALLVSGCKVTGGGWMSTPEGGRANFGFCAAQEDVQGGVTSGKFTYRDKNAGVSISGDIVQASGPIIEDGMYFLSGTYHSTNPMNPGSGEWSAIVQDLGEPGIGDDYFQISIDTGPFSPYSNSGILGGGNIQAHPGEETCD